MLWFNYCMLGLIVIFFCFKLIAIHYHTQKQKKIKIKPRIKLNHNINIKIKNSSCPESNSVPSMRRAIQLPLRGHINPLLCHIPTSHYGYPSTDHFPFIPRLLLWRGVTTMFVNALAYIVNFCFFS